MELTFNKTWSSGGISAHWLGIDGRTLALKAEYGLDVPPRLLHELILTFPVPNNLKPMDAFRLLDDPAIPASLRDMGSPFTGGWHKLPFETATTSIPHLNGHLRIIRYDRSTQHLTADLLRLADTWQKTLFELLPEQRLEVSSTADADPDKREHKVWGLTGCVYRDAKIEVHHLSIDADGYCSRHRHVGKWNLFHVLQGRLLVHFYGDGEAPVKSWRLEPARPKLVVEPGQEHRFQALTPVECLEIYGAENLDPNDIVRKDSGGVFSPDLLR